MQNLENNTWEHFYKYDEGFDHAPAVMVYEPFVNNDKNLYKMSYNNLNDYFWNKKYTDDLVQFYFDREVYFLEKLNNENFAPEVIDINKDKKEIIFKWYDTNLNRIMHEGNIDERLPDWKQQILKIVDKLKAQDVFKLNLYPHTCYIDNDDNVRIYDMYGCIDLENSKVREDIVNPILTDSSKDRFLHENSNGYIDLLNVYKVGIQSNAGKWPENFLNDRA